MTTMMAIAIVIVEMTMEAIVIMTVPTMKTMMTITTAEKTAVEQRATVWINIFYL